jgi:hypothetical protein
VSIDDDVRAAFEEQHGVFYLHAIQALFPLGDDMLNAIGGAQIVDDAGRTLWFT